ncbi:MAG: hypothetical protein WCK17_11240, partial [Verrucomicrobiota bacterium]
QPWNWVSSDILRRITAELGNVPDALPDKLSRLRGRLVDASLQVDKYQAEGNLTFDDLRTIYAEAYREAAGRTAAAAGAGSSAGAGGAAEVVYHAHESSRGNHRNKDRTSSAESLRTRPTPRKGSGTARRVGGGTTRQEARRGHRSPTRARTRAATSASTTRARRTKTPKPSLSEPR